MRNSDFLDILSQVGLNDKEAKIYLLLLEYDSVLASTISRKSGIKRTTVYMVLESLKKKGYVTVFEKSKTLYFKALDPDLILEDFDAKYRQIKQTIPELKKLSKIFKARPNVQYFEGPTGLIRMMDDTLTASNNELLVWSSVDLAWSGPIADYFPEYINRRIEKGIWVKGIFIETDISKQYKDLQEENLREICYLPGDKFPFENEINIYDNKLNIISFKDEIGVIIENEEIANTQKTIFNLAWEYAKLLEELKKKDK
jgi:sugar-specific transcriptional regulator TrmB